MLKFWNFLSHRRDFAKNNDKNPLTIEEVKSGLELLEDVFADISDSVDGIIIKCCNEVERRRSRHSETSSPTDILNLRAVIESRMISLKEIYLSDNKLEYVKGLPHMTSRYDSYDGPFFYVSMSAPITNKNELKRLMKECFQAIQRIRLDDFDLFETNMAQYKPIFSINDRHILIKDIKNDKWIDNKIDNIYGRVNKLSMMASFSKKRSY